MSYSTTTGDSPPNATIGPASAYSLVKVFAFPRSNAHAGMVKACVGLFSQADGVCGDSANVRTVVSSTPKSRRSERPFVVRRLLSFMSPGCFMADSLFALSTAVGDIPRGWRLRRGYIAHRVPATKSNWLVPAAAMARRPSPPDRTQTRPQTPLSGSSAHRPVVAAEVAALFS